MRALFIIIAFMLCTCKPVEFKQKKLEQIDFAIIDSIQGKKKFKAIYIKGIKICNYTGTKKAGEVIPTIWYFQDKYQNEFAEKLP